MRAERASERTYEEADLIPGCRERGDIEWKGCGMVWSGRSGWRSIREARTVCERENEREFDWMVQKGWMHAGASACVGMSGSTERELF